MFAYQSQWVSSNTKLMPVYANVEVGRLAARVNDDLLLLNLDPARVDLLLLLLDIHARCHVVNVCPPAGKQLNCRMATQLFTKDAVSIKNLK